MAKARIDNIGKFDINVLAALHLILSERSVGKAALSFGLSQPAMSNALARVRSAFDDPLLVRTHGRMELTTRGQQLLEQLEVVLPQLERLAQPSDFDPGRANMNFQIGATDYAVQVLGPPLVAELSRRAPASTLFISTMQSREIASESIDEHFDLRLGWFVSPPPRGFIRKLLEDTMVVIVGTDNREIGDRITADQFIGANQVGIRTNQSLSHTGIDKILHDRGLSRNVTVWTSNFSVIPRMVSRSNLIALMPLNIARRYQNDAAIRILPPPVQLDPFTVSMAWSPKVHHDPANRWLRSLVVETARDCDEVAEPNRDEGFEAHE